MSTKQDEYLLSKIEEVYNSIMDKPFKVLSIFNDFFGENLVDMQGYMSLEEFQSWVAETPIKEYLISLEYINMFNATNSYEDFKEKTLIELPVGYKDIIFKDLHKLAINIGVAAFYNLFILVHFPHVRVTNENNRYVDINHLWAKVDIDILGKIKRSFTLNRSEYTLQHFVNHYLHSHVNSIPTTNFEVFQHPCLGNGPIRFTINSLKEHYNSNTWNMFCLELSKYVTVESIAGVPYHRLENLGADSRYTIESRFQVYEKVHIPEFILEFVRYFINTKKLRFNYVNGSYSIGMSLTEYIILISNEFITWFNNQFNLGTVKNYSFEMLKNLEVIQECIIHNNKIYGIRDTVGMNSYISYIGAKICTFKGHNVTLNITEVLTDNKNKTVILNTRIALYILSQILKILNYNYGKETTQSNTEVWYL